MSDWLGIILKISSSIEAWQQIFDKLKDISITNTSAVGLHKETVEPDRLLAEAAWGLWHDYHSSARRTSQILIEWWNNQTSSSNRAVLILDAMSLRELAPLLGGAQAREIEPISVDIAGSEVPSDTDQFAKALGVNARTNLKDNRAPGNFALSGQVYTDVISTPFEDSISSIPNENNILIWHSWLDDLIHVHRRLPDQIYKTASETLQSDGFWSFVDKLRQGRRLIITADHGYGVGRQFSTNVKDKNAVEILRDVFGASRCVADSESWTHSLMPPLVLTQNGHHVVMGQTKWRVQGGFPHVCHGGLSLLEVAVPFVELPAI